LGPGEDKIDCGGPCKPCPYLKVKREYTVDEIISIVVINPRENLLVKVVDPDGNYTILNVTKFGLYTYKAIPYRFNKTGIHRIELIGYGFIMYDSKEVNVRAKPLIVLPTLPRISESKARSLLIPLLILTFVFVLFIRRRKAVVADEFAIGDLVKSGEISKYKRIYTTYEVADKFPEIDNIEIVELNDMEIDKAEEIAERYDIPLSESKILILCRRLRAKKLIIGFDIPKEVEREIRGVRIVRERYMRDYMKVGKEMIGRGRKKR